MERTFKRDIEDTLGTFAKNFPGIQLPMLSVMARAVHPTSGQMENVSTPEKHKLNFYFMSAKPEDIKVGFLDIDICGPSQPRVLGTAEEKVHSSGVGWSPVYVSDNLAVMSVGFLLNSADDAVIWKGPKKDVIDEVVFKHVAVDEVALLDVRKEITFCRKVNIPIIGLVENMTTFVCPKCKTKTAIFPATTGCDPQLAEDTEMPLLGQLPLDPWVAQACDEGTNIPTRARCCCHSGIQRHCKQNQGVL
ncbi:LOW QUALITY PROTEIN: cytosolic Fe-S cluster assembly factor Nubp1 homolog [Scylla paramamosain]|uniref:LOW QUALITY PROTEIN: cytosolic Fe-S cluster assembly factor Nubp1 homolog n=1 Tax=Scylla paramamosain TaxID=85552 RepID=UPI0030837FE9